MARTNYLAVAALLALTGCSAGSVIVGQVASPHTEITYFEYLPPMVPPSYQQLAEIGVNVPRAGCRLYAWKVWVGSAKDSLLEWNIQSFWSDGRPVGFNAQRDKYREGEGSREVFESVNPPFPEHPAPVNVKLFGICHDDGPNRCGLPFAIIYYWNCP